MNLKKVSYVLFLAMALSVVFGLMTSFAGKSDIVSVNGTNIKSGDEFTIGVTIEEYDKLISACSGNVVYDSTVLELKEISNAYKGVAYNGGNGMVRYAGANAIEGMSFSEDTMLMEMTFEVKSTGTGETSIRNMIDEVYVLDKENKQDIMLENDYEVGNVKIIAMSDSSSQVQDEIVKTGDATSPKAMAFYIVALVFGFLGISMNRKPKYRFS